MKLSDVHLKRLQHQSMVRAFQEPLRCEHDRYEYEVFDLERFAENLLAECVEVIEAEAPSDVAARVLVRLQQRLCQAP